MLTKAGAKSLMSVILTIIGILWDRFPDAFPEALTAQDTWNYTENKHIKLNTTKALMNNWLISILWQNKLKIY